MTNLERIAMAEAATRGALSKLEGATHCYLTATLDGQQPTEEKRREALEFLREAVRLVEGCE